MVCPVCIATAIVANAPAIAAAVGGAVGTKLAMDNRALSVLKKNLPNPKMTVRRMAVPTLVQSPVVRLNGDDLIRSIHMDD